jgi:hypothetical protein
LHAVHQDAPDLGTIDPPPLEHVSRPAPAPLLWIGRRKDFVSFAADRLQSLAATERGIILDRPNKRFVIDHDPYPLIGSAYIPSSTVRA